MSFIYVLAGIFIFGFLVAIHELGHFLAARLCGVRVNEFSIGRRERPGIPSGFFPSAAFAPWTGRTGTPGMSAALPVRAFGRSW